MADLDEISLALGRLQANAERHDENDRRIEAKIETKFDAIFDRLACLPAMKSRLDKIEPNVESLLATRQRTFGIAAGVAAVVTSIGGAITWAFK